MVVRLVEVAVAAIGDQRNGSQYVDEQAAGSLLAAFIQRKADVSQNYIRAMKNVYRTEDISLQALERGRIEIL